MMARKTSRVIDLFYSRFGDVYGLFSLVVTTYNGVPPLRRPCGLKTLLFNDTLSEVGGKSGHDEEGGGGYIGFTTDGGELYGSAGA